MSPNPRVLALSFLVACASGTLSAAVPAAAPVGQPYATGRFQPLWTGIHPTAMRDDPIASAIRGQEPRQDNPAGLLHERWMMMTGGDRTITARQLLQATGHLRSMGVVSAGVRGTGAQDADLWDWEWIGPDNVGGRVRAILFDPNDSNRLWAGTATGGISVSNDGGFSWSVVNDFLPSLSVTSLAVDPSTGFLYAGTGEFAETSTATGGGFQGAGIFRSTDGGVTWTQLPSTSGPNFDTVSRIAIVPADGFMFAATDSGLFRSADQGATWSKILNEKFVRDVKATATSHLVLAGTTRNLWRSPSSGNGSTFTRLTDGSPLPTGGGRCEVVIAPDQLNCYVAIDRNGGEVWRSQDGGVTWQSGNAPSNYLSNQGWYDNAIWVDPTNANVVVVAGIDAWVSNNGGASFTPISDWTQYPPSSAHADHHAIVHHPGYNGTTNRIVYFGNDGGVQRKEDILAGGGDWTNLSNGLRSTQFYRGAIDPSTNDLLGGLQDNGTWRRTGSSIWTRVYGGDGGFCSFDPSGQPQHYYWEYVTLQLMKPGFFGPVECWNGITDANNICTARFIAPFTADPNQTGRVFAGGSNLWRSDDYANSWTMIRGPVGTIPGCGSTINPRCSAMQMVPTITGLIWVGYENGFVSRSTDGGTTWTNLNTGLPGRVVTDIAINRLNSSEVFVTFGGFTASNVWFTNNGGTTWSVRTGSGSTSLPVVPVEAITIHPNNPAWIYAGTSVGVLASEDKGLTWGLTRRYPQSEGPAYTQVSDLMWEDQRLIAFTYGRGVFRSGVLDGNSGGPSFANAGTFPGVNAGSAEWGDYDSDGDLDVVWTGSSTHADSVPVPYVQIAQNNGATFAIWSGGGLPGVYDGAARWGDYDRDGFIDLVVTGATSSVASITRVYRNVGGTEFTLAATLDPVDQSDAAWGDYDNDGDLDLVVSGRTGGAASTTGSTRLYLNVGGNSFVPLNLGLANVRHSSVAWGDYDTDGDLDLLLAGWQDGGSTPFTRIYRNEGNGSLAMLSTILPGADESAQWGDVDNDGDQDLLLLGGGGQWVVRNDGFGFFTTTTTLFGYAEGEARWADYDGDGDLDIAVSGRIGITNATDIYRNDAGTFVDTGARLNGARQSAVAWGDRDGDGDPDLFLGGFGNVANVALMYRNDASAVNDEPGMPSNVMAATSCDAYGLRVTFSWSAAFDDHTASNGLSYNLRIGTTAGGDDVMAAMADGFGPRRVAALGNTQSRRSWTVKLAPGTYYWGVQAIDGSYKGSAYAWGQPITVAASFTNASVALQPVNDAASWGDYDSDGDHDLLLTGSAASSIYRNDAGSFTLVPAGLPAVDYSASAWGDYDNDGDLDLALCGCVPGGGSLSRIYRNDGGSFSDIAAGLPGICLGALAWGDWDSDGDLDLLLAGEEANGSIARVYRNNGGTFMDASANLTGLRIAAAAWADDDGDGDLDLLLTGLDDVNARRADLYRNDELGNLTLTVSGLPGVMLGSLAWGDYDLDNDLDLLFTGSTGGSPDQIARIYRNDGGGTLTNINAAIPGIQEGSAIWGDLDNDGRLDLFLTGYNSTIGKVTRPYFNRPGNVFLDGSSLGLPPADESAAELADFDGDDDLDVVLVGRNTSGQSFAGIYRNCTGSPNAGPSSPGNLTAVRNGDRVTFSWTAAADDHSANGAGLTYNLRIGTTPGGGDVTSPMASPVNGQRRVTRLGNAQARLSTTLWLGDRRYYWSVQAVDAAHEGGAFAAEQSIGITLESVAAGLPALYRSAVAWGDYDNDGDLDLVMAGTDGFGPQTHLFQNDGGTFVNAAAGLPAIEWCSLDWGDYDRDGDLDLALAGWNAGPLITRIYRNDAGTFVDAAAGLPGVIAGTVAWGDSDRDGDLDLFVAGAFDENNRIARMYRNENGTFVDIEASITGVWFSSADWGDYDKDGDLDIVVQGNDGSGGLTRIYRNDDGKFEDANITLPGAWEGSIAWGDYDSNTTLDLLLVGWTGTTRLCSVLSNMGGGTFMDIGAGELIGLSSARAAWGDYDNDGDLDIVAAGYHGSGGLTQAYRNDTGNYIPAAFTLPGVYYSAVAWGDYDNDRDLDLAVTGAFGVGLFRNDGAPVNQAPAAPTNLTSVLSGTLLTLSWNAATDDHTAPEVMTYNVRVGTTPGGSDILAAHAAVGGFRRVARRGNAEHRTSITLITPLVLTYWSVQAVDGAFIGSAFAPEVPPVTDVPSRPELPVADALGPASPNPMSRESMISLAIARGGRVEIDVFDIAGHHVATLFRGNMEAGFRTLRWNLVSEDRRVAAGVYLLRMQTPQSRRTLKLVVIQ